MQLCNVCTAAIITTTTITTMGCLPLSNKPCERWVSGAQRAERISPQQVCEQQREVL